MIESAIGNFLNKHFIPAPAHHQVERLEKFFVLPFFGKRAMKMNKEIDIILRKFYPYLNPRLVLRNKFTIGSLFKFKDQVPKVCRSAVVYRFSYPSCGGLT